MAGTVKKLQFSEGTDVGAPTDLGIASSTVLIQPYASDAAYVSANGAAVSGSAYLNTTLDLFRYYTNSVWHNALNATDATDNTKSVAWDFAGQATGLKTTFAVAASSSNKVITFPNITDTVVTRASVDQGSARLQNKDADDTTFAIVDSADTTKKIAFNAGGTTGTTTTLTGAQTANRDITFPDATTTLVGTDTAQTLSNKTLASPIVSGGSLDQSAAGAFALLASAGANTISVGGASSTVRIVGNLQVDGTTTTVNSATLEVTDANVLVNNGGNDASSEGAGLQVERTGTNGSIIYADAAASKWKVGALGAELEVLTSTATQSTSNKAITASTVGTTDIDGGTASNTSRITIPKASTATLSGLTRKQGTIVHDTTLNLPFWDDGASLQSFGSGSGSGSGEVNVITNPSAATAVTGITDGTSHTTTRVTSGSPLDPVTPTAFSIAASTTAVESSTSGARFSPTMPTSLRNKKLKLDIYFTTEASQTWAVSVYANGTRLSLSTDSSGATTLPAGTTGKFTTYVDTNSESAYTVNLTRTAGSGTATLIATGFVFGPGIQPQGAVVGDEDVSGITFVGFGTVAATTLKGYRRGNMLVVQGAFQAGTVSADNMRVVLPSHLVIDETKYQSTRASVVGQFTAYRTGASQYPFSDPNTSVMFYDGANGESVYITNSSASDNLAKVTGSAVYSNSQYFSFEFEIPVAAWTSSGTVNLAQNDVEYVYNTTVTDADDTTAFGYGPGGGQFPGVTTTSKTKRVRFLTPIQTTDHIVLETSFDAGVTWGEVGQHEEDSAARYQIQNTLTYGMQLVHINSTDLDVRFGIHRTVNPSVGYGSAGSSWTDIDANNTYKWRVKKVKSGQAVGFGLADTAGNAGLVNPYSSSGAGVVYSGTWTPTLTNTTNIDSSTAEYCIYSRIGKIVSGHMRIQINPTADNATTTLGISLPIASAFTSGNDAIGNGTDDSFDGTVANNSLRLAADSTNDRFTYNFTARDTGAATHYISFSYEIK